MGTTTNYIMAVSVIWCWPYLPLMRACTVNFFYKFSRSQPGCHLPNSPWPGKFLLFPARESLVSDIPPGDGKIENLFLQCIILCVTQTNCFHENHNLRFINFFGDEWCWIHDDDTHCYLDDHDVDSRQRRRCHNDDNPTAGDNIMMIGT